jgi:septal ring factor EnvC (AmiA/AmiB activator)
MQSETIARIRARRAALVAQFDSARLQYADMEEAIKEQQQSLALLQRSLDAMHGGLRELDALLTELEKEPT